MVSNMVAVVENCTHMVVEETCSVPLEKVNSMVVEENCKHMVVEEICTQP